MIDRRAFLRRLGFGTVAAAAAAIGVFDVEKLLWLPNEKTIFIPDCTDDYCTIDVTQSFGVDFEWDSAAAARYNQHYDRLWIAGAQWTDEQIREGANNMRLEYRR